MPSLSLPSLSVPFGLYLAIRNAPTCFLNAFDRALTQSTNFYCRLGVDLWLLFCFLYYLLQPAFVFIYLMLFALSNNFMLFFFTILFRFVISILCAHCWATKIYILFACHKRDFIVGIYRSCMYNFLLTLFFFDQIFCYWVIEKNVYKVKSRTVGFGRKMWTWWTWHINMNGFFSYSISILYKSLLN